MANKKPIKRMAPPRSGKGTAKTSKAAPAVKAPAKKAPQAKGKTAVAKASASKKPAPSKSARKAHAPVKKAPAKTPVKKVPAKPSVKVHAKAPAKPSVKAVSGKKPAPAPKPAKSVVTPAKSAAALASASSRQAVRPPRHDEVKPVVHKSSPAKRKNLTAKELEQFRKMLLSLRDRIVDEISFLTGENLNNSQRDASGDLSNYSLHMADQGTDNFEREFALSLVSTEHDVIYEIDEALHRIENGTYGICEMTGEPIEIARLKVLPYARFSVAAQSQMEKGRGRHRPRPFETPLDATQD